MKKSDSELLERAIKIAIEGIYKGGGPFGAIITKDGEVLSEAYNEVVFSRDPTAHAEILAIRKACEMTGSHLLEDCILYTSCEPCPMCLGAIYWAGIKKVVYAADREDAENSGFSDRFIYDEILKDNVKRKVKFLKITSVDGIEVFRQWTGYENKVPY